MKSYKLLTPGPLTTTRTVKQEMLVDHCTWDDDYKKVTSEIREKLLKIAHCSPEVYTSILMQGSGSFGVESVLSSAVGERDRLLILSNGEYGQRMGKIAQILNLNVEVLNFAYNEQVSSARLESYLNQHPENTHVAVVHCETTTGIINDLEAIAKVTKKYDQKFIVDAMSSFGGIDIEVEKLEIDFLISSANKCIQGVPGFSFIIAKISEVIACKGQARSLCLSLYDQWETMDIDGKWRYTSPTHSVLAFAQALKELELEGGVSERNLRYRQNMHTLREGFSRVGLLPYLDQAVQSPIIATFQFPVEDFDFSEMYAFVKKNGYAIYPGKLLDLETFRIGVIGEIYPEDIEKLIRIFEKYLVKKII